MDPRHSPVVDTRGVHPVMTMAGIMPGGSQMRHWHQAAPFPDPDEIARELAAGHGRTHAQLARQAQMEATEQRHMELGTCFRPAGACSHDFACVRCPYLHVDDASLPRLLEIEADTEARLAAAEAKGLEGEVIALTDTLAYITEKKAFAIAASAG